jgi:hypothetical protein
MCLCASREGEPSNVVLSRRKQIKIEEKRKEKPLKKEDDKDTTPQNGERKN